MASADMERRIESLELNVREMNVKQGEMNSSLLLLSQQMQTGIDLLKKIGDDHEQRLRKIEDGLPDDACKRLVEVEKDIVLLKNTVGRWQVFQSLFATVAAALSGGIATLISYLK